MIKWLSKLDVSMLKGGRRAELNEEFSVRVGKVSAFVDEVVTVPKGFVTDFASIPRVVRSFIPQLGRYSWAAVVHDYLYSEGDGKRKDADLLFLALMASSGVPWWKRRLIYRAVRLGGWVAWRRNRKRREKREADSQANRIVRASMETEKKFAPDKMSD